MAAITSAVIGGASLIQGHRNAERAEDAARESSRTLAESGREGIEFQREQLNRLVGLQDPFLEFGEGNIGRLGTAINQRPDTSDLRGIRSRIRANNPLLNRLNAELGAESETPALNRLTALTTDPNAQAAFIQNNPFFDTLAEGAQDRLFANRAARGKLGSGGTAAELQNRLVMLGSDLLNREISGLQGTAGLSANIDQQRIGNLLSGAGLNANLEQQDIGNLFGLFGAEQGLQQNRISNLFNAVGLGQNAASLQGNAITGAGNQITNLLTGIGNARAAGQVGAANAGQQGFNNILNSLALGIGTFDTLRNQ